MIQHVWTVLCSRSVIDIESNNVSIQNVVEQINVAETPKPDGALRIPLELVSLWVRSDPDVPCYGRARYRLIDPLARDRGANEIILDLTAAERIRARVRSAGFTASVAGRYLFRVELDEQDVGVWHQVAEVPLRVVFEPPVIAVQ